jgi:hypothetical protein
MTAQVDMEASVHMVTDHHGALEATPMNKHRFVIGLSISTSVRLIGIDHAQVSFIIMDFQEDKPWISS